MESAASLQWRGTRRIECLVEMVAVTQPQSRFGEDGILGIGVSTRPEDEDFMCVERFF